MEDRCQYCGLLIVHRRWGWVAFETGSRWCDQSGTVAHLPRGVTP